MSFDLRIGPRAEAQDGTHAEAAAWFARRQSGQFGEEDAAAFMRWLEADSRNEAAFAHVQAVWEGAEALRRRPEMLKVRRQALRRRDNRLGLSALLAAAASLAALFSPPGQDWLYDIRHAVQTQEFRTGIGQQVHLKLSDGTVVMMNTDSVLRAHLSRRRRDIELLRGEALFEVAKDHHRPFVVESDGKTVTALGTKFSVRSRPHELSIVLLEGKVRVAKAKPLLDDEGPSADLSPGMQLIAQDHGRWTIVPASPMDVSWTQGKIVFDKAPLSQVAAELNRYMTKRIVISEPRLANEEVSGSFRIGDTQEAVKAIVNYGLAKVVWEDGSKVVLGQLKIIRAH